MRSDRELRSVNKVDQIRICAVLYTQRGILRRNSKMKARQQILWISVGMALVALVGLTWVQLGLLRDSTELKEQIFESRVRDVLGDVVRDLETMEIAATMPIDSLQRLLQWQRDSTGHVDSGQLQVIVLADSASGLFKKTFIGGNHDSNFHYRLEAEFVERNSSTNETLGSIRKRENQSIAFRAYVGSADSTRQGIGTGVSPVRRSLTSRSDSLQDSLFLGQDVFISQVVHRLSTMTPRPLRERVNREQLDSLFSRHLKMAGIALKPAFAVFDSNALLVFATADTSEFSQHPSYAAPLFPFDMGGEAGVLRVRFPDQESYFWGERLPTIVASTLFISMLAATVLLGLVVIRKQDRVRMRTQEFIANLTHEFTTPVSTIQLAVEALEKDTQLALLDRASRMVDMIGSENRRMRAQVQKILQLAQLEEGELQLSYERVDLCDLIRHAAQSFELSIEQRAGELHIETPSDPLFVYGDRTHLRNLVSNLIDNAIKYSPVHPNVLVALRLQRSVAELQVTDKGIGIAANDQATVFQKFVRGSTGNVHDVKGFGIGLSYVKAVAESHNGSVGLVSEPGVGTTLTVRLPLEGKKSDG